MILPCSGERASHQATEQDLRAVSIPRTAKGDFRFAQIRREKGRLDIVFIWPQQGDHPSRLVFLRRSDDAEFLHSAAERIRVKAQDPRRAAWSVNNPARPLKGGQNVVSHVGFQAFERRSRSSGCCCLRRNFGRGRR
jgi:hypothetical protein